MALKENDLKWLRPLWLRIAITVFLAVWCAWEWFWNQDSFWGLLVTAALAYSIYNFFITFPKEQVPDEQVSASHPTDRDDGPSS